MTILIGLMSLEPLMVSLVLGVQLRSTEAPKAPAP